MTEICLITGNHPRHKYFAMALISTGRVCSWVIEEREEFVPRSPMNINGNLKRLFEHHFNERQRVELEFFGSTLNAETKLLVPSFKVGVKNLNGDATIQFIKKSNPRLVISYGCHKLKQNFLESLRVPFWNVHGGLSPMYRGVGTHFWPSYFLEPQMTGMTLHETTMCLDGGDIILQTAAPMVRGDSLHRLAARNVVVFSRELAQRVEVIDCGRLPVGIVQSGYGKVFMTNDWRPEHLCIIYETYNDRVVDQVIDGVIKGRSPELISAF